MQKPKGATAAELAVAMAAGCAVTPKITLLNTSGKQVGDLSDRVLVESGQVSWLEGDVTRALTLDLIDPTHSLNLDSESPADGAIYADRMIRATQVFTSPLLPSGSCSVDVFTGPIVKYARKGAEVSLEMHGKESRARTDVRGKTIKKGRNIVDAIEDIMRDRCGERSFAFPKGVRRELRAPVHVGRADRQQPWEVCQRLAASINHQLFYDGSGTLVLRRIPSDPVVTLTPVASEPAEVTHDWTQVYNRVVVTWSRRRRTRNNRDDQNREGRERRDNKVSTAIDLDDLYRNHPFGPKRMAANGTAWTRTLRVDGTKVHTARDAREMAERRLRAVATQMLDVKMAAIPAWHLDPRDPLVTPDGLQFVMREAQSPLMGGPMTFGTVESVRRPRR